MNYCYRASLRFQSSFQLREGLLNRFEKPGHSHSITVTDNLVIKSKPHNPLSPSHTLFPLHTHIHTIKQTQYLCTYKHNQTPRQSISREINRQRLGTIALKWISQSHLLYKLLIFFRNATSHTLSLQASVIRDVCLCKSFGNEIRCCEWLSKLRHLFSTLLAFSNRERERERERKLPKVR